MTENACLHFTPQTQLGSGLGLDRQRLAAGHGRRGHCPRAAVDGFSIPANPRGKSKSPRPFRVIFGGSQAALRMQQPGRQRCRSFGQHAVPVADGPLVAGKLCL